ncbi:hypothetical protein [Paludisphaera mucosa]|uniref:Uncharacterized protein n=1 Tax=Paludisphaera mucosa TaxID=3030827 RepID=A0ABT6F4R8_9BACT|nr:hypothetical protein [Paludisphaera mucosa]MDG3002577.1 hypothetical protein [Paludisphaera mucosa]
MNNKKKIAAVYAIYAEIRRRHPGEPVGEHWEGRGAYLGEGVYADPEWCGVPGELEFA